MQLLEISTSVYETFTSSHVMNHYTKTLAWAHFQQMKGNTLHLLGLYDEDTLVATAFVIQTRKYNTRFFYLPMGPCLDAHNESTLKTFFQLLTLYANKHRIAFIKCGMNLLRTQQEDVKNWMEEVGYQHKGYHVGYDGSWQNRFTLTINLTQPLSLIKDNYSSKRKTSLKQQSLFCINVRRASSDELYILTALEKELAQRKGFRPRSLEFFERYFHCFKENCVYIIAEAHLKEAEEQLVKELLQPKYQKDPEALEAKIRILRQIKECRKTEGDVVVIGTALYLTTITKAYNLYLYHTSKYSFLHGSDIIHDTMIEYFKQQGFLEYDFCGFSGRTDSDDLYYGLYQYKSSFGSKIVEYLGEFNCVLKHKKTIRFHRTDRFIRQLKRKINKLLYFRS